MTTVGTHAAPGDGTEGTEGADVEGADAEVGPHAPQGPSSALGEDEETQRHPWLPEPTGHVVIPAPGTSSAQRAGLDATGRSTSSTGRWLRTVSADGAHLCRVPRVAQRGDVWRCDTCGKRWTARMGDDLTAEGGLELRWSRRWWPWPR